MTAFFASAHDGNPGNIVILSAAKDLSSSLQARGLPRLNQPIGDCLVASTVV
jgi:hypothetical protein